MNWSPQQESFLDWAENGQGSCVLIAVAGAGKTTVLLEGAKRMRGGVAIMAYNKDIATDIKDKLKRDNVDWKKAQAGTVHSFGFAAVRKASPMVRVVESKVRDIFEEWMVTDKEVDRLSARKGEVLKLVSLAKQSALGVDGCGAAEDAHNWHQIAEHYDVFDYSDGPPPIKAMVSLGQRLLAASNKNLGVVDFDDMVYLPLVHQLPFWRHDVVMVDEAQDTNAARRAMVRAMVKKGGRVVAVGDPHQAIYGFTGADSDALELIKQDFNCIELPLTITYRCPKDVVEFAHQWVDHIEAADTAPQGRVSTITVAELMKRNDLDGTSAVLCRLNRPLVSLAFDLIRAGKPCRIAGRDIGASLKRLLTKWKVTSFDELEERLDTYLDQQTTRLLAKKQEAKMAQVEDQVETVRVVINQCRKNGKYEVSDAVEFVDRMFADQIGNLLTLSSIHKAKGREWENVFWLDRENTCPSKWARQKWQKEQEKNLCYVAATRSKAELIEVLLPPPERNRGSASVN